MKQSVYPHRLNIYFAILMALASIGGCYLGCRLLDTGSRSLAMGYLIFAGVSLLLGKHLMDVSKFHAEFSPEGLTVIQGPDSDPVFFPWENIRFACRSHSRKGHGCLILSAKYPDESQIRSLVQKAAWTSKLLVDDAIVLFLQQQKDPDYPESLLPDTVPVQEKLM